MQLRGSFSPWRPIIFVSKAIIPIRLNACNELFSMLKSNAIYHLSYLTFKSLFIFENLKKKNRKYSIIPLLSLSNMLHKLHFINDSLSVLMAGLSADADDFLLAYYLGNIYVVKFLIQFFTNSILQPKFATLKSV